MSKTVEPLVSICIPAYNVENTLAETLHSILHQTYPKIEIILIDDGSTDNTSNVAQSITDDKVHYIRNESNLGGFQTMNKAISLAKGDLVAVYHHDDIYEPTIVEKEVAYLNSHPQAGAVFCLAHFMDYEGKIFGGHTMPHEFSKKASLEYEDIFLFLLRHKNILLCCPTFMARHKVLDIIGSFDAERFDSAADLDMWIRIARKFPIGILNERLMKYRVGKGQWIHRYQHLRVDQELYFSIMDHYLKEDGWLQKLSHRDVIEYSFHRCDDETFRAANLIILGDIAKAADFLRRPYPWGTLMNNIRRRKLRVLLLRALMKSCLAVGSNRLLIQLLKYTEYGGRIE